MSLRKPATGVALTGGILAIGLASADGRIVVQYDATYSLPESRGFPCSGSGEAPVGETCPKAGDIATDDCRAYLLSFNGAVCVAPVDAQCVIVHDNVWGCAFPKTGYISAAEAETFRAYDGESSGWGSDESVQVIDEGFEEIFASANYDTTLDKPLGVNCDVATETMTQTTTGASKGFGLTNTGESTPDTHITEGGMTAGISTTGTSGKNTVDYGSTFTGTTGSAQTAGDYGSTTTGTTIIDFGTTGTTGTPDIYNTGRIDTMERGGTTLDNTVDTTDYTTGGSKTTGSYTKYGTTVLGLLNRTRPALQTTPAAARLPRHTRLTISIRQRTVIPRRTTQVAARQQYRIPSTPLRRLRVVRPRGATANTPVLPTTPPVAARLPDPTRPALMKPWRTMNPHHTTSPVSRLLDHIPLTPRQRGWCHDGLYGW